MSDGPPIKNESLYDALAEPAPPGAEGGDTILTAAKETIDRDREVAESTILLDER
jgi:hypothetical protein